MIIKKAKLEIKKGLIIRDPIKKMAHEGVVTVTLTTFWRRRIKEGDCKKLSEYEVDLSKKKNDGAKTETPQTSSKKNTKKSGGKE